jgi:hypothetical protein
MAKKNNQKLSFNKYLKKNKFDAKQTNYPKKWSLSVCSLSENDNLVFQFCYSLCYQADPSKKKGTTKTKIKAVPRVNKQKKETKLREKKARKTQVKSSSK